MNTKKQVRMKRLACPARPAATMKQTDAVCRSVSSPTAQVVVRSGCGTTMRFAGRETEAVEKPQNICDGRPQGERCFGFPDARVKAQPKQLVQTRNGKVRLSGGQLFPVVPHACGLAIRDPGWHPSTRYIHAAHGSALSARLTAHGT